MKMSHFIYADRKVQQYHTIKSTIRDMASPDFATDQKGTQDNSDFSRPLPLLPSLAMQRSAKAPRIFSLNELVLLLMS